MVVDLLQILDCLRKCIKQGMCDFNFPVIFISLGKSCPSIEHLLSFLRYWTTGFECGEGVEALKEWFLGWFLRKASDD